jgi:hypothetical protein
MSEKDSGPTPPGGVPLSAAIGALRDDLMQSVWAGQFAYQLNGRERTLRFKPAPIEVSLQVAVTGAGTAKAGVRCWLIEAGGQATYEKATTQTVKLTLQPVMFDEKGQEVEFLIDAADSVESIVRTDGGDDEADAPD